MESKRNDNSDALAKMKTMTAFDQELTKNAAKGGKVEKFEIVLRDIKFPIDVIVDMNKFMVTCQYLPIEDGMLIHMKQL